MARIDVVVAAGVVERQFDSGRNGAPGEERQVRRGRVAAHRHHHQVGLARVVDVAADVADVARVDQRQHAPLAEILAHRQQVIAPVCGGHIKQKSAPINIINSLFSFRHRYDVLSF